MKYLLSIVFSCLVVLVSAQKKNLHQKTVVAKTNPDLVKINDSIPALIPQKNNGKYGFINQKRKTIIPYQYSNVGFFTEDCNLLNSPNAKVRKYGSNKYASVRINNLDFRIDSSGKRVYVYKNSDLGKCILPYVTQLFHAFFLNNS